MPTQTYYRIWCKTCNDFTLPHRSHKNMLEDKPVEAQCNDCKTEYTDIFLSEIPEAKLVEQRKRYTEKKRKEMEDLFSFKFLSDMTRSPFDEDWPKPEIVESDAGQKSIDEAAQKIRDEEHRLEQIDRQRQVEEKIKYSSVGRNDLCLCGSGKKYKKCCLQRISEYRW